MLHRIYHVIGELPTYDYRRIWALLHRQAELNGIPAINTKRVYRIMRQNAQGYRSQREYLRQRVSNGASDNRCLGI